MDESGSGHGSAQGEDALGFALERDANGRGPQSENRLIGFSRLEGGGIVDEESGRGRQERGHASCSDGSAGIGQVSG